MAGGSWKAVYRELGTLFRAGAVGTLSDGHLLDRFLARDGDVAEVAFETLVRRHGPMVLGVCRRVLRDDPHAAEDAFQATFLVLALKAGAIRKPNALGPWLYGVALRLARRARTCSQRRREELRCSEVAAASSPPDPVDLGELHSVLDEELSRLPEKYRRPVVLCYLEGKTNEQAAAELGWTKGTVSGRLARARDLLQRRLTRRGLAPAVGALGATLWPQGASASLPTPLVSQTIRMAMAASLGRSAMVGAVSGAVIALAEGGMKAMLLSQIKATAAITLVMGAVAGAVTFTYANSGKDRSNESGPRVPSAGPVPTPVPNAEEPPDQPNEIPLPAKARVRLGTTNLRHEQSVGDVAFAPDGRTLASTGWDGAVRFWDVVTGQPAHGLEPLKERGVDFVTAAYAPDGSKLAIGRDGGLVQLWDLVEGRDVFRSQRHKGRVQGVAFAPDGLTFATASAEEPCVRLWDVASGEAILTLNFDEDVVYLGPVAFSPDGSRLALGTSSRIGEGATIRIWNLDAGGEPVVIHRAHEFWLVSLVFAPGGATLISGGSRSERVIDETGQPSASVIACPEIRLWDGDSGRISRELEFREGSSGMHGIGLGRDGTTLVSLHDNQILVWDLELGQVIQTIETASNVHAPTMGGVALSPDDKIVAAPWGDHKIHLWDLATGEPLFPQSETHHDAVLSVAYDPDGRLVATASADGTVRLWDTDTGKQRQRLDLGVRGWVRAVRFSPDGTMLAAANEYSTPKEPGIRGMARLWDLESGRVLHKWKFDHRAAHLEFSPDGERVAIVSWNPEMGMKLAHDDATPDHAIHIVEVATGRKLSELEGHEFDIFGLAFAPNGHSIVSASRDMTFRFWNLDTGDQEKRFAIEGHFRSDEHQPGEPTPITSVAFSPDVTKAVTSALWDDRLIVWDLETGQVRRTIHVEGYLGAELAFAPDGRLFASISTTYALDPAKDDDTIRLWETATGRELLRLETGGRRARSLAFSSDGLSLVTGMNDTTTLIWDVREVYEKLDGSDESSIERTKP